MALRRPGDVNAVWRWRVQVIGTGQGVARLVEVPPLPPDVAVVIAFNAGPVGAAKHVAPGVA